MNLHPKVWVSCRAEKHVVDGRKMIIVSGENHRGESYVFRLLDGSPDVKFLGDDGLAKVRVGLEFVGPGPKVTVAFPVPLAQESPRCQVLRSEDVLGYDGHNDIGGESSV